MKKLTCIIKSAIFHTLPSFIVSYSQHKILIFYFVSSLSFILDEIILSNLNKLCRDTTVQIISINKNKCLYLKPPLILTSLSYAIVRKIHLKFPKIEDMLVTSVTCQMNFSYHKIPSARLIFLGTKKYTKLSIANILVLFPYLITVFNFILKNIFF